MNQIRKTRSQNLARSPTVFYKSLWNYPKPTPYKSFKYVHPTIALKEDFVQEVYDDITTAREAKTTSTPN